MFPFVNETKEKNKIEKNKFFKKRKEKKYLNLE